MKVRLQYFFPRFLSILLLLLGLFNSTIVFSQYLDPSARPFYHGIASGDPLPTQVIIWTRVTPDEQTSVPVKWTVAKDEQMTHVVQSGTLITDDTRDFTVKVDVQNLQPGTTYYYLFEAMNAKSPVGKTKTAPTGNVDKLRFAVVSCNNYSEGYFTVYSKIAEKPNVDAIIHLGDYIYEGLEREFDKSSRPNNIFDRPTDFKNKQWWLTYFRNRYSLNCADASFRKAHQNIPFIAVWDDHEVGDNSYKDSALGHNPQTEGLWRDRVAAARQAYAEWVPIRSNGSKIYREITYGNLVDLLMLDTRLEGRDMQVYDPENKALFSPTRSLLGKEQKSWLFNNLKGSTAKWKILGNQVIFSDINIKWARAAAGSNADKVKQLEYTLLDYWEGYPVEKDEVVKYLSTNNINNTVILSASMHCAYAFDVALRSSPYSRKGQPATYDPKTGKGSVAVEFATPSISSGNFDERVGSFYASTFQSVINTKLPFYGYNPNPHMKFVDLIRNGYYLLDIDQTQAKASFYFLDDVTKLNSGEKFGGSWLVKAGTNRLQKGID